MGLVCTFLWLTKSHVLESSLDIWTMLCVCLWCVTVFEHVHALATSITHTHRHTGLMFAFVPSMQVKRIPALLAVLLCPSSGR